MFRLVDPERHLKRFHMHSWQNPQITRNGTLWTWSRKSIKMYNSIIFHDKIKNGFLLILGARQTVLLAPLLFKHLPKALASFIKQENGLKGIQIWKKQNCLNSHLTQLCSVCWKNKASNKVICNQSLDLASFTIYCAFRFGEKMWMFLFVWNVDFCFGEHFFFLDIKQ